VNVEGMLIVERFAVLAAYLAVVWVAIRRAPRSKWALCAIGLLPVAVFQSASSVSHDALTTAISLLVLSSALRALDPPDGTSARPRSSARWRVSSDSAARWEAWFSRESRATSSKVIPMRRFL
jgi:hypothetical protein